MKFGSHLRPSYNSYYVHDIIELQAHLIRRKNQEFLQLYQNGCSIRDICKQYGMAFTTVRNLLEKQGVTFRPKKSATLSKKQRQQLRPFMAPPFGYCYHKGQLTEDPKEYKALQIIKKQSQLGITPTDISKFLNSKKIKTRMGKSWTQAHLFKIIQRLKESKNKEYL